MTWVLPPTSFSSTILCCKTDVIIALISCVSYYFLAFLCHRNRQGMGQLNKTCSMRGEQQFPEAVIQRLWERACCSSSQHSSVPTAAIEDGSIHCPSCCSPEAKSRELSFLSSSSFLWLLPRQFSTYDEEEASGSLGRRSPVCHKLRPAPKSHGCPLWKRQHIFWCATNTTQMGVSDVMEDWTDVRFMYLWDKVSISWHWCLDHCSSI